MTSAESTYQSILEYEKANGIEDPSAPDEEEDIFLSPEDEEFVKKHGNKLPPVPEGKDLSPSMINFARSVTKAYQLCYFQFLQFVDNKHPLLTPDILGYCTRKNIDEFFKEVVSKRVTSPAVNRHYVSAIQKYSDYWEERIGFKVDSVVIKKSLEDAKVCKKQYHTNNFVHVDAHKHIPTKHPSPTQEMVLIDKAFADDTFHRHAWIPVGINFLISWNCAMQGFTRGDEVRNCRLADLCHEINYGPWRLGEQGRSDIIDQSSPNGIISMIQQPFSTKLMCSRARAVGFFRHRDWRRCATSAIAFSIMGRFHTMTPSQLSDMFKIADNGEPIWYQYYLIDLRKYDSMAGCFKTYFAQADIEYTKVTHVRKLGIIRAHQMGADRENIILLSKHTVHKVDNSYLPELPYQAMLAAAGFDIYTRQEYFVPRTYAQVPPEWIGRIFPYIDTWKIQVNETWGYDKGKAAKSFVNCLLPHLAQIVLQDGMYLATAYPKHTYAKILLQKMHNSGYESWCCEMKEKVLQRELALQEALNEDRRYDAMLRTTEHTVQRILSIDNSLSTLTQQFIHLRNFMEKWQHNPITTPQNSRTTLNAISEVTPVNLEANAFRTTIDDFPIPNGIRTGLNVTPNTHCIQGIPITLHSRNSHHTMYSY
jgi:hypothetical protein